MARPTSVQDAALGTTSEFSQELAPTAAAEAARQEIQAAVILAKRFPRNEDEAYAKIIRSCKRPTFASDVEYSFPRGGKSVTGPSIYLAREFARAWGNIRHGCDVIADSDEERTIRAWAWDLETNVKVTADATFKKLIFRKNGGWIKPDERDMRELTNKHAALAKRNCLLELLPSDMVEDACIESKKTLKNQAAADPDAARKALINAFADLNVPIAGLEKYLGHPLAESSPDELAGLRTIYKSIKDGNSTWSEYLNGNGVDAADMAEKTKAKAAAMKAKMAPEPTEETRPEPDINNLPTEPPADTDEAAEETAAVVDKAESQLEDLITLAKEKLKEITGGNARKTGEILNGRRIDSFDSKAVHAFLAELEQLA